MLPPSIADIHVGKRGSLLSLANGSPIRTYGVSIISLDFGHSCFSWVFVIANVLQLLLGADFL